MSYLLIIKADTNDADYIESTNVISQEELDRFMPLINAIKKFKPYKSKGRTHYHNFPVGECCREDMGEKSIQEIYSKINEDIVDEFNDMVPYSEYGTHTIQSIKLYEIVGEVKELL